MRVRRRRQAILSTLLLLAAGLFGGLVAGAPSAAAGGPPDDPGSQGQDQGKGDEKRPDHAGQKGGKEGKGERDDGSDDGEADDESQDDQASGDQAEDEEPPTQEQSDPDGSEEQTTGDDQEDEPSQEEPATEHTDEGETVDGHAPLLAPLIDPAVPEAGQLVHLDAGAWDPDGQVVAVDWFLADGDWLTGGQVSHVFELPGNHSVEIVATDDQGYTTSVTVDVQVLPTTAGLQTPGASSTPEEESDASWQTGTGDGETLQPNGLGTLGGGSDPLATSPPSLEPSGTDRPLGSMAAVAAFLVGAVALVARAE